MRSCLKRCVADKISIMVRTVFTQKINSKPGQRKILIHGCDVDIGVSR